MFGRKPRKVPVREDPNTDGFWELDEEPLRTPSSRQNTVLNHPTSLPQTQPRRPSFDEQDYYARHNIRLHIQTQENEDTYGPVRCNKVIEEQLKDNRFEDTTIRPSDIVARTTQENYKTHDNTRTCSEYQPPQDGPLPVSTHDSVKQTEEETELNASNFIDPSNLEANTDNVTLQQQFEDLSKITKPSLELTLQIQELLHQQALTKHVDYIQCIINYLATKLTDSSRQSLLSDVKRHALKIIDTDKLQKQATKAISNVRSFHQLLKRPSFPEFEEDPSHISYSELTQISGTFDGTVPADLATIWSVIRIYGQSNQFQERHFVNALLATFKGAPLQELLRLLEAQKSIDDILEYFEVVYLTRKTHSDLHHEVSQIERKTDEKLDSFIARASLLLDKIKIFHDENTWTDVKEAKLKHLLLNSIPKELADKTQFLENELIRDTGTIMSLRDIIMTATKLEKQDSLKKQKENNSNVKHNSKSNTTKSQWTSDNAHSPDVTKVSQNLNLSQPEITEIDNFANSHHYEHAHHQDTQYSEPPQTQGITYASDEHTQSLHDGTYHLKHHKHKPERTTGHIPESDTVHIDIQTKDPAQFVRAHAFDYQDNDVIIRRKRSANDSNQYGAKRQRTPVSSQFIRLTSPIQSPINPGSEYGADVKNFSANTNDSIKSDYSEKDMIVYNECSLILPEFEMQSITSSFKDKAFDTTSQQQHAIQALEEPLTRKRSEEISSLCQKYCYERSLGLNCAHTKIAYDDSGTATKFLTSGTITLELLQKAQQQCQFVQSLVQKPDKRFKVIENLVFNTNRQTGKNKLVLPNSLLEQSINAKHYSAFGIHFSKTRIKRDLTDRFYIDVQQLNKMLNHLTEACTQCQFNSSAPKGHIYKNSNFIYAPRVTWAVDIIPSLTTTKSGNTAIFLAVDMFTGYVQLKPLKSRKTEELIEAVKATIIQPFGIPKFFRCDNESSMANSTEFYRFMAPLDINFLPCSTASPWSNGAAERGVQTIKLAIRKFCQQECKENEWDDYLHFFVGSHNKSTSVYGFAPEHLHFGFSNPAPNDLVQIWPNISTQEEYVQKILKHVESDRKSAREKASNRNRDNITRRNLIRTDKKFAPGQIVLHRQLQVSTGQGGALKPLFTGPYLIDSIDKDKSSAVIEHLHSGQRINAHFTNIKLFNFDPYQARLPEDFDAQIDKLFPTKHDLSTRELANADEIEDDNFSASQQENEEDDEVLELIDLQDQDSPQTPVNFNIRELERELEQELSWDSPNNSNDSQQDPIPPQHTYNLRKHQKNPFTSSGRVKQRRHQ